MSEEFIEAEDLTGNWGFGPEIVRPDGTVIKADIRPWAGQSNPFPRYDSQGGEVGVQLPGPDAMPGYGRDALFQVPDGGSADGAESGPIGEDFRGVQSYGTNIVGVQLPGNSSQEPGYDFGEDMRGLAQRQDEPPTNQDFGDESDMATSFSAHGDESNIRVFGQLTRVDEDIPVSDILSVFNAVADAGGHSPMSGVPGMDSLRGIPLGAGSGVVGGPGYQGQTLDEADGRAQGAMYGSGDGDGDEEDFNRYPGGSVMRPS